MRTTITALALLAGIALAPVASACPAPDPEGSIGHPCASGTAKWTGLDGYLVCANGVWVDGN